MFSLLHGYLNAYKYMQVILFFHLRLFGCCKHEMKQKPFAIVIYITVQTKIVFIAAFLKFESIETEHLHGDKIVFSLKCS